MRASPVELVEVVALGASDHADDKEVSGARAIGRNTSKRAIPSPGNEPCPRSRSDLIGSTARS